MVSVVGLIVDLWFGVCKFDLIACDLPLMPVW